MQKYLTVDRWALETMPISAAVTYAYICTFSRKSGGCSCSVLYLAGRLGVNRRTVMRAVQRLENDGFIRVSRGVRARNQYTINAAARNAMRKAWRARSERESMPETLRIDDDLLAQYGASLAAVLLANLRQLQAAAERKAADGDLGAKVIAESGVIYGQRELAAMCGCTDRELRAVVCELAADGVLDVFASPVKWGKSRKCYKLRVFNNQNEPEKMSPSNDDATGKNVTIEPEKMSPSNGDEPEKMSPNESNPNESNDDYSSARCAEHESGAVYENLIMTAEAQREWMQWAGL